MFYSIWQVAQWLLDPVTRRKVTPQVSVHGVFEFIDPRFVPEDMGGLCTYEPDVPGMEDPPAVMHRLLSLPAPQSDGGAPGGSCAGEEEEGDVVDTARGSIQEEFRHSTSTEVASNYSFHTTRQTEAWPATMRGWVVKEGHIVKNW